MLCAIEFLFIVGNICSTILVSIAEHADFLHIYFLHVYTDFLYVDFLCIDFLCVDFLYIDCREHVCTQ